MQVIADELSSTFEIPKSPIFKLKFLVRKMFADFKSRWRIFLLCSDLTPKRSCTNQNAMTR